MSILEKINLQTFIPLFETFLIKQGFRKLKEMPAFSIWNVENNPTFETDIRLINLQSKPCVDDVEFTEKAIDKLARHFASSSELILKAILDKGQLIKQGRIHFRVIADDVENGKIAFMEGIELFKSTRAFIEYFARSTQKKKAVFHSKKTAVVNDFMKEVQLGQTQKGSYIINIYYPIEQPSVYEDITQTSFAECVNQNISSGLTALSAYLENKDNAPKDPGDFIQKGISSNLCESLIRLSGHNQHRDVEVVLYDTELDNNKQIFTLKKSNIDKIKHIATQLVKDEFDFEKYEVTGKVIERHSLSGNNEEGGRITVKMEIYGRMRSINVDLDPINYKLANRAVAKNKPIHLCGRLHIKKEKGELTHLTKITILNDTPLF